MQDHWELVDLAKACLALLAGAILGLEREMKDKAAGLKTMSVISLGSALFAIISYKVGIADGESTRIASYIVSGIGFIGAGVIFKDGVTVSGLTTASIIWLAAAVGTSIGFGEFFLALTFMLASLVIVFSGNSINKIFRAKKQSRALVFVLDKHDLPKKDEILFEFRSKGIQIEEQKIEMKDDRITVTVDTVIKLRHVRWAEEFLVSNTSIREFEF